VDANGGDVEECRKSAGEPRLGRTYVKSDRAEFQIQDYRDNSQEVRPMKIMLTRRIRQKQPKNETFTDVQGSAVVTRVVDEFQNHEQPLTDLKSFRCSPIDINTEWFDT
jgi:hypothetical protein